MKVMLCCKSVSHVGWKRYRGEFSSIPNGKDLLVIECDCPVIPGTAYELCLSGKFPGFAHEQRCIGGILSFQGHNDHINAVEIEEELNFMKENGGT